MCYSGPYTINAVDVHPVVGPTTLSGFYVANGFSGHGFKLASTIGILLGTQITKKSSGEPQIAPEFMAFDRLPVRIETKSVMACAMRRASV